MLDAKQFNCCMCLMSGLFPRSIYVDSVDAIFVWGRAFNEYQPTRFEDGVLTMAADLYRLVGAPLVIPGYTGKEKGQGDTGYPGPAIWRAELAVLGVPDDHVLETCGKGYNTKTEMDDCLDLALRKDWSAIIGVTQLSHAMRAMLGTVKSLANLQVLSVIRVLPVWPQRIDWTRLCFGSQGKGPHPRAAWIDEEFERIPRYQEKGDLATLDELFQYLMRIHQQ
jgi:hypothetical protein